MYPGIQIIICILLLPHISSPSATPFHSFYPRYAPTLTNLSENVCNESLALLQGVNYSPANAPPYTKPIDYCYAHENCILENLPPAYLANYQASAVIMGLTPTILASIGPSVAETSLLSAHRALLSFLISVGAPAVYPTRVFEFTDPYSVLRHKDHLLRLPLWLGGGGGGGTTKAAVGASVLEYAFAMAAVATVILTSMQLGEKTTLVWACTNQVMPLVWTSLSAAIHVMAACAYRIALSATGNGRGGRTATTTTTTTTTITTTRDCDCHHQQSDKTGSEAHSSSARKKEGGTSLHHHHHLHRILALLTPEFRFVTLQPHLLVHRLDHVQRPPPPIVAVMLSCFAGIVGFWHEVFGTVIFLSLAVYYRH